MGGSALLFLGLVINVLANCCCSDVEIEKNLLGVLGESVVLKCQYLSKSEIMSSSWAQKQSNGNWKQLVVYFMQNVRVNDKRFSVPVSPSNLTITMNISTLEDEREYKCSFTSEVEIVEEIMTLTVLARPSLQTNVGMTLENGTDYQKVTCSAAGGKPEAVISWLVYEQEPSDAAFSVTTETLQHSNGTFTQTSMLLLPVHRMREGDVTCVVNHPTLASPIHMKEKVQTFVAPTVTMETTLTQENGEDFQMVTCKAMDGRPAPRFTWSLSGDTAEARNISAGIERKTEENRDTDTETVISSCKFPVNLHEGQNVTCLVMHPMLPSQQRWTITLPTYRFSGMRALTPKGMAEGHILLEEGQSNVTIQLEVTGNVPRYQISCTKEDGPLPADVNVMGGSFWVSGPVGLHHVGKYECQASYYNHKVSVEIEMEVIPREVPEALLAPNVTIQTWEETNRRTIQCTAADAIPGANVSWVLPEGLHATVRPNSTLQNGTHTVSVVLLLPVCLPEEHRVQCAVEHPALIETDIREMTIPACSGPEVNVSSTTIWENGTQYTLVTCRADSGKPAATITWSVSDDHGGDSTSWSEEAWTFPDEPATVLSTVRIPTQSFHGRTVACIVTHKALAEPVRRETWIPAAEPPELRVSLHLLRSSPLYLAACESSWKMGTFNLSWVLPLNAMGRAVQHSATGRFWANSTYEFPLDLHEGQNLTCQAKNEHVTTEKTIHIPQFYISSLRLLNPVSNTLVQRVPLKTHVHNQRISLKVCGKIPSFNVSCARSDGSPVKTEGATLVFPGPVSLRDAGLYTCRASFYHHYATLSFQVEVTEENEEFWNFIIICVPAALAVALITFVSVCILCYSRRERDDSKCVGSSHKRESLAALTSLLAEHRSPELRKPPAGATAAIMPDEKCPPYPELVRYSIVIDIKTTV